MKINIALHSFCIHYISNPWQPFRQNKAWISPCHSLVPLNGRARCRFPLAWWRDPFPSFSFGGRFSNCWDNLSPLQCILRRDAVGGCGFLGQGLLHRAHASKGLMAGLEGQPGFEGTSRMGRTLVSGLSTHPHFCQIHTGLVLESDKLLQKHTGVLWQGNVKNQTIWSKCRKGAKRKKRSTRWAKHIPLNAVGYFRAQGGPLGWGGAARGG